MADTPQDAETAAREASGVSEACARRAIDAFYTIIKFSVDGDLSRVEDMANDAARDLEHSLALRPASSPGAVTVADRERLLCSAIARGFTERGRFGVHMFETEAENEAYKTGLADAGSFIAEDIEAGLPPALLSTTQTEAGNGR